MNIRRLKLFIASIPIVGDLAWGLVYGLSTLRKIGGVHSRDCSLCGFSGRFRAHGNPPRWDARCPKCNSLERHRLLGLLLGSRPEIVKGRTVHFAPEPSVTKLIGPLAEQYETADFFKSHCDLKLNLEDIELSDGSVDTFIVSHVLEHVSDTKALPELFRCLRPGGSAIIMVPIIEGWQVTYENPDARSDKERLLHFGQADHVRFYGADIRDRITDAGFILEEYVVGGEDTARYGLVRGEAVFIATKLKCDCG